MRWHKKCQEMGFINRGRIVPNQQTNAASDRTKALLEAAEKIDTLLQEYSARDAFRIVEICKVLVTSRQGSIQ